MVATYADRRRQVLDYIGRIPGLSAPRPRGTFYCFVSIGGCLGRQHRGTTVDDADTLANLLDREAGVKVVSGMESGSKEHIRVSFAVSERDLDVGLGRIREFLASFT
jgi:aspartate aminotransferase